MQQSVQLLVLFLLYLVEVEPVDGVDCGGQLGEPVLKLRPSCMAVEALSELSIDLRQHVLPYLSGDCGRQHPRRVLRVRPEAAYAMNVIHQLIGFYIF